MSYCLSRLPRFERAEGKFFRVSSQISSSSPRIMINEFLDLFWLLFSLPDLALFREMPFNDKMPFRAFRDVREVFHKFDSCRCASLVACCALWKRNLLHHPQTHTGFLDSRTKHREEERRNDIYVKIMLHNTEIGLSIILLYYISINFWSFVLITAFCTWNFMFIRF